MMKRFYNVIGNPLFSGSAIMIVGSNTVSFLNYLYHLVMGRMLGPANYGELAALISLIGLLGMIPVSVSLVIIKYVSAAKDEKELNNLISWLKSKIFLASLFFCAFIIIIAPAVSSFLHIPKISYMILIAVSYLFSIQSVLNRSILQGLLKFKEMVSSTLLESAIKLVISIALLYFGFMVGGAMFALVIASLLGWYITNFFLKDHLSNKKFLSPPNLHSVLIFIIPAALQSIATTSLYTSDVILVKHFFPAHDAGIYASLSTLGKIIFFGTGPIGAVMFPLVSKRNAQGKAYKKIFGYSFLITILVAACVLLIYWLFPQLAIMILYGPGYLEAASLLVWFGVFISLFTLSSLIINYGLSLGKTSIVVFPLIAAAMQIILILFFHQTLFMIILISVVISALLLASLLIYSIYGKRALI